MFRQCLTAIVMTVLGACGGGDPDPVTTEPVTAVETAVQPGAGAMAYTNVNLWDGTGAATVPDAWLLVRDGRVEATGTGSAPAGAETTDLDGAWVVPGFINAHGHVSGLWAADDVRDEAERVSATLALYARYGVTTLLSLGDSAEPALAKAATANRTSPGLDRARAYIAGSVVANNDPAAARRAALANVELGVDYLKLRIDDNLGSGEKMPWEAAQAAIQVAQQNDIPVATHIFYMDDAAMVLAMGSNLIAHSVRDREVSDEFVDTLLKTGVCYVPTLVREVSTFVYSERPAFFDDPFFLSNANAGEMARVTGADYMARIAASDSAAAYRQALVQAQENLKLLATAGVPIAFGTDSGPAGRFPGYFEHMEFDLMAEAGLSPREILLSTTSVAADCLHLEDVGTLETGKWADFVVLEDDPLADIRATRTLRSVYVAGNEVR